MTDAGREDAAFEEWWADLSPEFDVDPDYPLTEDHKDMARAGWDAATAAHAERHAEEVAAARAEGFAAALKKIDEHALYVISIYHDKHRYIRAGAIRDALQSVQKGDDALAATRARGAGADDAADG